MVPFKKPLSWNEKYLKAVIVKPFKDDDKDRNNAATRIKTLVFDKLTFLIFVNGKSTLYILIKIFRNHAMS